MRNSSVRADSQAPSGEGTAHHQIIAVTGASSGLGLETAKQLAGRGAEIVMICRDQARGERARSQVAEVATGKPPALVLADLSVQAEVRRAAQELKGRYEAI